MRELTTSISLTLPEPLALIEATLLFTIQVLIAKHPDLLLPDTAVLRNSGIAARRVIDNLRELHHAIAAYRAEHEQAADDLPF